MPRLRVGIVRFGSASSAIARALGVDPAPDCRIGRWRITITFRRLGATRWHEERQIEYALQVAGVARRILAKDPRRAVRERTGRAIEVVYEDATMVRDCAVLARWKCVVPAES